MHVVPQHVFNAIWNGYVSQGWAKSVNEIGMPCAHGINGSRCAVGWSHHKCQYYNPGWHLQKMHDESSGPDDLRAKMTAYARTCGLSIPDGEDAAFAAFKAKILAPITDSAVCW